MRMLMVSRAVLGPVYKVPTVSEPAMSIYVGNAVEGIRRCLGPGKFPGFRSDR